MTPNNRVTSSSHDGRGVARPQRAAAGYSMVEVLAAAFLLLAVMLSIMTMFIIGGQQINSGKLMTQAVSIAEDILEDFRRFGHRQTYQVINDTGIPENDTRYVWDSVDWNPGDVPPENVDWNDLLAEWKRRVEGGPVNPDDITQGEFEGLPQGEITITVRGLEELGSNPDEETFNDAKILQVMVTVRWVERKRERSVVFETLKT